MADGDYPALGFDPAPGNVEAVGFMVQKLDAAVTALQQGDDLFRDLANTNTEDWQGDAAEKFRQSLKGDLTTALEHAHDSLQKASKALDGWRHDLAGYQTRARALESRAETALAHANATAATASASSQAAPAPGTEGPFTPAEQAKINQARSDDTAATRAHSALTAIRAEATKLQGEHDTAAKQVAKSVKDAPDHLAPHKPGFWSSIGHFFEHPPWKVIGDVLSDISAVAGVVAIFTPPPIDAIALGISVGTSVAAFGAHVAGGDHNPWDLGADVLGAVPGIGILGDAAKEGEFGARALTGLEAIRDTTAVSDLGDGAKLLYDGAADTARAVPAALQDSADALKNGSWLSNKVMDAASSLPGATGIWTPYAKYLDAGVGGVLGISGGVTVAHDFGAPISESDQQGSDNWFHAVLPYFGASNLLELAK